MNILSLNSFRLTNNNSLLTQPNKFSNNTYGLKMKEPLPQDTVSFKGVAQSSKKMSSRKDAVNNILAKKIRVIIGRPHLELKRNFNRYFAGKLSTDSEKNLFTLMDRIKTENSIREKSATRGWSSQDEILSQMGDLSGFCFVLEDKKSFGEFVKTTSDMIKDGIIKVDEVEYHRLAPVYKKGEIVDSFDSLPQTALQRLKKTIIDKQNPTTQFWKEVDSMSGYSGLHITLKHKDGTKSEVQVMTRAMANLKDVENLDYKIRNGKTVASKYRYIEQILSPLKTTENPTPQEIAMQKAIRKYTQEAYVTQLKKPFADDNSFLKVADATSLNSKEKELINDFDFNSIYLLKRTCDKIAKIN